MPCCFFVAVFGFRQTFEFWFSRPHFLPSFPWAGQAVKGLQRVSDPQFQQPANVAPAELLPPAGGLLDFCLKRL